MLQFDDFEEKPIDSYKSDVKIRPSVMLDFDVASIKQEDSMLRGRYESAMKDLQHYISLSNNEFAVNRDDSQGRHNGIWNKVGGCAKYTPHFLKVVC